MLTSHIFGAFLLVTSSLATPVTSRAQRGVELILDDLEVALNKSLNISSDAGTLDSDPAMFPKVYDEVDSLYFQFDDAMRNLAGQKSLKGTDETRVFEAFELVSHALQGDLDIFTYQQPAIERYNQCGRFALNMHRMIVIGYLRYADPLIDLLQNEEYIKDAEELVGDVARQETEFYRSVKCRANSQGYSRVWEMAMSVLGIFVH